MISIKDLSFSYGKVPVLDGLKAEFEKGKVHGILGINGSGKTTLFNLIYGLLSPDEGGILIDGKKASKKDLGFLETQNFFYPYMTGREYVNLFHREVGEFDVRFWEELFRLPLEDYASNYSTGMKKKLALMALLRQNRPILLLDEPFNGIDLESARVLMVLIKTLNEKDKTIFMTSHILETLEKTCDFIHVLDRGKLKKSYFRNEFSQLESEVFLKIDHDIRTRLGTQVL